MPGPLHELLSRDHERLDALLATALRGDGTIDAESFVEFRRGILRHIGIEERVLFRELRKHHGETELERQLHRDHAAIAALLVPPPTAAEIEAIRAILVDHNPLEEDAGGLYEMVEEVAGKELPDVLARANAMPVVKLAPYADSEILRQTIEQLVREANEGRRALAARTMRS